MSAEQQQYLAAEIALWFQSKCGEPWEFLGCHNLTGISAPRGDTNPVYCRIGKNTFAIQRTWRGTPGLGSLTVVAYDTVVNDLQELNCAFNLIALHSASGADDNPVNYDYGYYYNGVEVTSEETDTHVAGMSPDEQTPVMLSMPSSFRARVKFKALNAQSRDVSLLTTNDIATVSFCDESSCDNFGNLNSVGCQKIFLGTRGGSPNTILRSLDGGSSFSDLTTPFDTTTDDIIHIVCDEDVVIAVNGTSTEYAYSWDGGDTWTVVTTPTKLINRAYILGGTKIWFVAQDGYIYFSSNRGASVSVQDAGQATSQSLNDISASSSLSLYAVGDNNAFVRTSDGGNIWEAVTGPSTGTVNNDLYRVLAIPGTDIVFVGDEEGNVYRSSDRGDTWTTVLSGKSDLIGGISGITACDCNIIMISGNDQDPYFYSGAAVDGVVYISLDGGNSFNGVEVPNNDGIRDLICCNVNKYWAVGDAGFVAYIAGPTS